MADPVPGGLANGLMKLDIRIHRIGQHG
jgi:hypothetical protein